MADHLFTMSSSGLPDDTIVVGFRGSEGISRLYAFEVFLSVASEDGKEFDPADAVAAKATLVMDRGDGKSPFSFNGVFSELSIIHEMQGRAIVRAILVPKLWHLTQTLHSRIFTKQSLPDIIKATLEDGGLGSDDYQLNLQGSYDVEEHVCQYRESHFQFISRWMEREGMYYFFEQGESGEKLIITDSKSSHVPLDPDPVLFRSGPTHDGSAGDCLSTFICRRKALPAEIKLRDYDFSKPDLTVSGTAAVSKSGLGEINSYGVRFFTPETGKRLAQMRAEDLLSRELVFTASGTARHLRAGYVFSLQDHPRRSYEAKYLATEVEHYANQRATTPELRALTKLDSDEVYRVDITAIPADTQFRSGEHTPWPRIYGTENAVVDGDAESPYAQIDDAGCYLVRFSFDESNLDDGKASTRVRMMQPHGGGVEGHHFPLRKGTEVMITFVGGDPDRPFIAGVVPNAHKPSVVGSRNHTQNVIRTGGGNQIVMEDEKGKEFIFISTPNMQTGIYMGVPTGVQGSVYTGEGEKGSMPFKSPDCANPNANQDATEGVPVSMSKVTNGDLGIWVKGGRYTEIGKVDHLFVGGDVSYGFKTTYKLKVGGNTTENYYSNREVTTSGTLEEHVIKHLTQTYQGGREQTITGGDNTCHWATSATFDSPKLTEKYGEVLRTVTGPHIETVDGPEVRTLNGPTTWNHGAPTVVLSGPWTHLASAPITMMAPKIEILQPDASCFWGKYDAYGWKSLKAYAVSASAQGLKIDVSGVSIAAAPLKIESRGFYLQTKGINLIKEEVKVKTGGIGGFFRAMTTFV